MLGGSRMKNEINTSAILKDIFKENWNEIFIFDGLNDRELSYMNFCNMILNCKETLEGMGIEKNDVVCLIMSNSIDLAILYFTSLIMQLTVVPIDINKGENDIKEILSQLKYKAIISNIPDLEIPEKEIIDINEFKDIFSKKIELDINELNVFDGLDYNKIFLITFTSGSTGVAKGVMHSFNNLIMSALAFKQRFNFNKRNIFYHNLPMTYMAGILNLIILPLVSESKIVIGERFNISNIMRFWDIPIRYSANTFWFIPTIVALLLKLDRGDQGINYARRNKLLGCVGTAPLNYKMKIEFETKYHIQLYESYGLSETLFITTNSPHRPQIENSVGEMLEGVETVILEDGEIAINVPWMFLGYTNIEIGGYFKKGKYLSGDIGRIDNKDFLYITGRKKDLIIRGGINISPKKIEDFIFELEAFEETVIMGFEDINLGEKIVCYFVPKKGQDSENTKKKLNREIIEKLGKDYHIDEFIKLEEIPKTNTGKADKPMIRAMTKVYIR